jgi:hypothetical protein
VWSESLPASRGLHMALYRCKACYKSGFSDTCLLGRCS